MIFVQYPEYNTVVRSQVINYMEQTLITSLIINNIFILSHYRTEDDKFLDLHIHIVVSYDERC